MKTSILSVAIVASVIPVLNAKPPINPERQATRPEAAAEQAADVAQKMAGKAADDALKLQKIPNFKQHEKQEQRIQKDQKTQQEAAARQEALTKQIKDTTASEFEEKNSELDLMRGKLTYATLQPNGHYIAYLHIRWGDLDQFIPQIGSVHYSNWDGSVKLEQGGVAKVVKEFAFDDRDGTTGGVDEPGGLGKDSGKKNAKPGEVGKGSGRDAITHDSSPIVAWKSGVVGATDGLLLQLDLRHVETRGTLKLGNFTIPFVTQLQPAVKP
jgi:hypothetical protein